ncbi:hypothetical protein GCM10022215_10050 [Nocardioides fonticola]|uniref:Lipocalin-like domain-containing protein n=1 Tax=Nocardioides fonticola TaxID=450363 RepID=A0ABP7XE01_9ACTN
MSPADPVNDPVIDPVIDPVAGTWVLISWTQEYRDGRVLEPMGPAPTGVITYAEGRMQCLITRRLRTPFGEGGQWDAPLADRARAYDECLAYAGRYEWGTRPEGLWVRHHVDVSLYPGWIGGVQERAAVLDGEELRLLAHLEVGTAEERTAALAWRRLEAGAAL